MAAILANRLLSPRADLSAADFSPTPRVRGRLLVDLFETLKKIWSVICEGLLLLWMLAVLAISLLIAAGAIGFLGRGDNQTSNVVIEQPNNI